MAWRARQRSEQRRAGGLKGRDRGWLPGSSQASSIGIPTHLVNKVRERTSTLVTRDAASNIAGGLTEPLPPDFGNGDILIDTRSLVVQTNQLSGIGRYRSQFNVDADGIKYARYYLPINPNGAFEETIGECKTKCEKARPNSIISIDSYILPGITTQIPQNIWTLRGPAPHGFGGAVGNANAPPVYYGPFTLAPGVGVSGISVYLYSIGVNQFFSQSNWVTAQTALGAPPPITDPLNEVLFWHYYNMNDLPPPPVWPNFNFTPGVGPPYGFPNLHWGPSLPKDPDEQQAYGNIWQSTGGSVAGWRGFLTGISNPITNLWIIADGLNTAGSLINHALIFTKSTNNPLTDYSAIPQSITGGAILS